MTKRTRRQAYGQHFLHDMQIIHRIVQASEDFIIKHKPHFLLEVGPGEMALSYELNELCKKHNVPLILLERDLQLKPGILSALPNIELVMADAANIGFVKFLAETAKRFNGPGLFVSNLPYSASSQILARLCQSRRTLTSAVVMVQKELAKRMTAAAGDSGRGSFSILMESAFDSRSLFDVSPGAFRPPPKVMSTVLELLPKATSPIDTVADPLDFERFCQRLFSGRRKMIRNLVSAEALTLAAHTGLTGQERPETLTLEQALTLFLNEPAAP